MHIIHLARVLLSPRTVAESIAHNPSFGTPFLIVFLGSVATGWLMMPFLEAPFRHIYTESYGEDLANATMDAMRVYFIMIGPLVSAGTMVIRSLAYSFLLVTLVKIAAAPAAGIFSRVFTHVIHCETVFLVMNLLTVIFLMLQGSEAITRTDDLIVFKGLEVLFDVESVGAEGIRVLSGFNLFTFWYCAIASAGLVTIAEVDRSTSAMVVMAAWLFWLLLDIARDHILSIAAGGLL